MAYLPRKPDKVFPWNHAVRRWCERIEKNLDVNDKRDYAIAEDNMVALFREQARFVKILENGRFMFLAHHNDMDIYFILERNEIVTVWDKQPLNEEILDEVELAYWEQEQQKRMAIRLYGIRSLR